MVMLASIAPHPFCLTGLVSYHDLEQTGPPVGYNGKPPVTSTWMHWCFGIQTDIGYGSWYLALAQTPSGSSAPMTKQPPRQWAHDKRCLYSGAATRSLTYVHHKHAASGISRPKTATLPLPNFPRQATCKPDWLLKSEGHQSATFSAALPSALHQLLTLGSLMFVLCTEGQILGPCATSMATTWVRSDNTGDLFHETKIQV